MNTNFPPNIDPNTYSILAVLAGIISVDDFSMDELNSIGNWIILYGQYLLTVSAQQQLIEARIEGKNININSRKSKSGNGYYDHSNKSNQTTRDEVEYLLNIVAKLQKELNNLKK